MKIELLGFWVVALFMALAATTDIVCGTNYLRDIRQSEKSIYSGRD